jgi:low affinity Fe/Cu permease
MARTKSRMDMNIGYVFLLCGYILWGVSGFIYGFQGIWAFLILLVAITITLGIRAYKLKHK